MCLINDHQFRTGTDEIVAARFTLDVVERNNRVGKHVKDGSVAADPIEAFRRAGEDEFGLDVKLVAEFVLPLFCEVGWTQHGHTLDLGPIQEFPRNQQCFDGFPDTDVVSDQEPHGIELQCHQEWHQLIGSRFDGNLAE